MMRVYGQNASKITLEKISNKLGLPLAPTHLEQTKAFSLKDKNILTNQILVLKITNKKDFEALLAYQPRLIIEDTQINSTFDLNPTLQTGSGFCVSLSTKTAYYANLAPYIYRMMMQRGFFYKDPNCLITLLHEIIANGLIHGNMGIHTTDQKSLKNLEMISHQINAALKNPDITNKHLSLHFTEKGKDYLFSVRDQGTWPKSEKTTIKEPLIRGLSFLKKYAHSYTIDKEINKVSFSLKHLSRL